jgi:ABC-type dipeptide/oligopeptide/nickel transport system permease subunit
MLTAKSGTALNGRRRSTAFGAVAAVLLALVVGLLIGLFAKWFSGRQARGVCVCACF